MMRIIVLLLFGILLTTNVMGALTDNRIAYWTFDDTNVDEINGITLTAKGGATYADGYKNQGTFLDGDAYWDSTWQLDDNFVSNMTTIVWVNLSNPIAQIYSQSWDGSTQLDFRLENNNHLTWRWYSGGFKEMKCDGFDFSQHLNEWIMLTARYGGTGIQEIYINDTECSSYSVQTLGASVDQITDSLSIGAITEAATSTTYWNGMIDELVIWNRTLAISEIGDYYENGFTTDTCSCPASGNWNIGCSDDCLVTSTCDMQGNNIYMYGTGTFTTTANIVNFNVLDIAGTDSSNKCIVKCLGGCFR